MLKKTKRPSPSRHHALSPPLQQICMRAGICHLQASAPILSKTQSSQLHRSARTVLSEVTDTPTSLKLGGSAFFMLSLPDSPAASDTVVRSVPQGFCPGLPGHRALLVILLVHWTFPSCSVAMLKFYRAQSLSLCPHLLAQPHSSKCHLCAHMLLIPKFISLVQSIL